MVYPGDAYHRAILQGMRAGFGGYIHLEEHLLHRHGVAGDTDGLSGRRVGTQELLDRGVHILIPGILQLFDLRHVHGIFSLGGVAWIRSKFGIRGRFRPTLRHHAALQKRG